MKYRVFGLDRESGNERVENIDAESSEGALKVAYDRGIVVEKVVEAAKAKSTKPKNTKTKDRISVRIFGDRKDYQQRGVNTVGEIAAGVFVGLLLFSCVSPLIFFVIVTVYGSWILSLGQQ